MKILSTFTHPQVVTNLYEFLSSAEHKGRYTVCTKEVNGSKLFSKYLPLCSAEERNSYRFATTWGWV